MRTILTGKEFIPKSLSFLIYKILQIISENTGDALDEWVDTHHFAPDANQKAADVEEAFSPSTKKTEPMEDDDDDDEPAMDMDAFVEGGGMEQDDPYRFVPSKKEETTVGSGDNIVKTRTYDLHITYDKYYQVCFNYYYCYYRVLLGSPIMASRIQRRQNVFEHPRDE